ncbi:hypothetical protein JX265_013256 [Neoarthrinium moseri]|uniref:Uncharacterized protein n=1 Tax=Neoarthrinium moseri TaxID=1658444 RepID=A0A9P9W8X2_9PEZI|nr:uncharacterized protein JN550_005017 [Neoarthrinium moseri]KAI1851138.1 hypothetical protein JX265_013256 [Neoarthrinium moseri]KAI1870871.1 hypothetical protein JN550_005017 [Neoarthrinium moseri]
MNDEHAEEMPFAADEFLTPNYVARADDRPFGVGVAQPPDPAIPTADGPCGARLGPARPIPSPGAVHSGLLYLCFPQLPAPGPLTLPQFDILQLVAALDIIRHGQVHPTHVFLLGGDLAKVLRGQDEVARAAVQDAGVAVPSRVRQGRHEDVKRCGRGLPEVSFRARMVLRRVTARMPYFGALRLGDEAEEQK